MAASDGSNDFWTTVNNVVNTVGSYKEARAQANSSAPSGGPVSSNPNPGFGNWNPFPQAQTKPAPGGSGLAFNFAALIPWIVFGAIGLLFLKLLSK